ncbi:MAG: AEC family transporter [Rhodospirillaceae bacterium]|nr:AEC family transporter [Rhodospirillaceae bacterium]
MNGAIIDIVGPVFLLVAAGYVSVRVKLFPPSGVTGLITFVNTFATPCLLFRAMLTVEFGTTFDPAYLAAFYLSAFVVFAAGVAAARCLFGRRPGESVVIGFAAYFTNTVLLGLPIIHRAYGDEALPLIYAIIGLHAPLLMSFGMIAMELARRDAEPLGRALATAAKRVATNPLLIGIALGLATNLSGVQLPAVIDDATQMMVLAVMPAALFGLGGALNEYKLQDSWGQAVVAALLKLVVHPLLVLLAAAFVFHLPWEMTRVAVVTAAMPSGLNVYIFSTFYHRASDVAANTVLIATVIAVATISVWLVVMERLSAAWPIA